MSRSAEFHRAHDPASLHPNMHQYNHEIGNTGEYESGVGYVRTTALLGMPGNSTRQEGVNGYRQKIRSGEGFEDPIMVEFDPQSKRAVVGEGNHRLQALVQEGIDYTPVRVVRSRINDDHVRHVQGKGGRVGSAPDATSPWTGGMREPYWPPSIHPRHVFPRDTL